MAARSRFEPGHPWRSLSPDDRQRAGGTPAYPSSYAARGHLRRRTALGVVRLGDAALLQAAGADLMVTSLDKIDPAELAYGRLCRQGG